ncbi:MAG: sigma-70 family RNA polymerase sigma factor [Propionicimonas sp.]|uniref:sigma-70 family RNA polymerase sigma factor n=1 Tax=Propionicimonas sp. TaxID=1955623 RepID=UPI003D0FBDDD
MHTRSTTLLGPDRERTLARAIEAGLLARRLLETGERPVPASADELRALVTEGERAWQEFLLANVRLVWKLTGREVRRSGLSPDELFQEGFVALADALRRYDVERGRFSTWATVRVRQHLAEVASARFGELALPPGRALRMRRARGLEDALGQERGGTVDTAALAVELGQRVDDTRRLVRYRAPVGLDPLVDPPQLADPDPPDPDAAIYAAQLRRLLARLDPEQERVLRLRFGFVTGDPIDQAAVAGLLGISVSTVRRLEQRAMASLRPLRAAFDPDCDAPLAG